MRVDEVCYSCIQRRAEWQLGTNTDSVEILSKVRDVIHELTDTDSWIIGGLCPAQLGTTRQQILNSYGAGYQYIVEKDKGRVLGSYIYEKYKNADLRMALRLAILGNGIEFDIAGIDYNPLSSLEKRLEEITEIDDLEKILMTASPGKLGYLLDNVGEHLIDAILIDRLMNLGWEVEVVVKGKSVLNDVTIEDMTDFPVRVNIVDTGSDDVGTFLSRIPELTRDLIQSADLLIIKGMANFETLSRETELPASIFLLRAKCDPVANVLGVKKFDFVWRYIQAGTPILS